MESHKSHVPNHQPDTVVTLYQLYCKSVKWPHNNGMYNSTPYTPFIIPKGAVKKQAENYLETSGMRGFAWTMKGLYDKMMYGNMWILDLILMISFRYESIL